MNLPVLHGFVQDFDPQVVQRHGWPCDRGVPPPAAQRGRFELRVAGPGELSLGGAGGTGGGRKKLGTDGGGSG